MTPEALIVESMFMIADKDSNDIPFKLNSTQRTLDENLTGRDIIPKARQEGVSSYFLARYTAACLSKRNIRAVVISHEGEATQRLLARVQYFLEHIRGPKAIVGRDSLRAITFPKTNSSFWIGTAGSRKFGRGDTITHLHCSEYAFWPNAKDLMTGLLQSVPESGEIAIESTGNGIGNDYYRRVMRAAQNLSHWTCHFFNWLEFPEYNLYLNQQEEEYILRNLDPEFEEDKLVAEHGLKAGQLAWRRQKLEDLDFDMRQFKQEYPVTLDECFQSTGSSIFHRVNFIYTQDWKKQDAHLHVLDPHPLPDRTYVMGIDPSGGVGNDDASIEIFCVEDQEQVAEFSHDRTDPERLGEIAVDLAHIFNDAFIVVEANNHGPVTIKSIRDRDYPDYLLYDMLTAGTDYEDKSLMQKGFRTTSRTKPIMIGRLRTALAHDIIIHSEILRSELSTFIEHENGTLGAESGCKDDKVMASACANMGMERASMYASPEARRSREKEETSNDPFCLDNIIGSMRRRGERFPVRPQTKM
jgi:hypothetical protein